MKKYFVIGNPIAHSQSPKLHNYWIKNNNIKAIYRKKKLTKSEIKNFLTKIKKKDISGANVTVPYKSLIIPYLDKLSPEAEETQSVNTICYENNLLVGYNTDITGFSKAIKKTNFKINNKKIFILGAGGVVPSIICALNNMKVSKIILSNRTREKATSLKKKFKNVDTIEWGKLPEFDVIINATSLGLKKNDNLRIDFSDIGKNKLFYDVIYNPKETNFLKYGKKLGNKSENGKLMFVYQASESFKLWHGIRPNINKETNLLLDL